MRFGGGMFEMESYDPALGFWLLTPQVEGTNVLLTLTNIDSSISYDILYSATLATNAVWNIVSTGVIGQVDFTVPLWPGPAFFRGAEGGDWDGDGIPNWMDADPRSTNVGALTITIDSPTNGTVLY